MHFARRGRFDASLLFLCGCFCGSTVLSTPAQSQCSGGWITNPARGANGPISNMTMWDPDGTGPQAPLLVVAGSFTQVGASVPAVGIATYDPANDTWGTIGTGGVTGGGVTSLAAHPDGRLFIAGTFTSVGGSPIPYLAQWNGSVWTQVGGPIGGIDLNFSSPELAIHTNGDLILAGNFTSVAGVPAVNAARWNGSAWSQIGSGLNFGGFSSAGVVHVRPNGDILVGGHFNGNGIARWNGSAWAPLAFPGSYGVFLATGTDGLLYGGGNGYSLGKLNGTTWSSLISSFPPSNSILVAKSMPNNDLLVGGSITQINSVTYNGIARWNGAAWSGFGSGVQLPNSTAGSVRALERLPNGLVAVGGSFSQAGSNLAPNFALLNAGNATTPLILSQPVSQPPICQSSVVLYVQALTTGTATYQWQWFTGSLWTNLSDGVYDSGSNYPFYGLVQGTSTSTFSITSGYFPNGGTGSLRLVITDTCGTHTTSAFAPTNQLPNQCTPQCDSIDFNNDTSLFDPQDIDAFLSVYGEGPCVPQTATCNDIDFNNDGSLFDPCDIDSFLLRFAEGPCSLCGQ